MSATSATPRRSGLRKTRERLSIAVFATLLILPWIGRRAGLDKHWTLQENRALAIRPTISWKWSDISLYPRRFEEYFNDDFGFRNLLTRWRSRIFYSGLHMAPSPRVTRGRDGRLFLGTWDEIESYQRTSPYSPEQVAQLSHYFDAIRTWLTDRNCALIVVVIPNKSTVYPEFMPAALLRAPVTSRADQLITALRERDITVIDAHASFAKEAADAPLYYRHDSHWTPYGADIVWRELLAVIYPEFPPPPPLSWEWSATKTESGDLVHMAGLDGFLSEQRMLTALSAPRSQRRISPLPDPPDWFGRKILFESDATDRKRAVVFHDSFANKDLDDLLAAHFSTLAMAWTYVLDPEFIRRHNPDVVVVEILERSLQQDHCFGDPLTILASLHDVQPAVSYHSRVGINVADADSRLGVVRRAEAGTPAGWLIFGRDASVSAGRYTARFRLRADSTSSNALAALDVATEGGKQQLAQHALKPTDLPAPNVWTDIDLPFEILGPRAQHVELRAYYQGQSRLDIESVSIRARD